MIDETGSQGKQRTRFQSSKDQHLSKAFFTVNPNGISTAFGASISSSHFLIWSNTACRSIDLLLAPVSAFQDPFAGRVPYSCKAYYKDRNASSLEVPRYQIPVANRARRSLTCNHGQNLSLRQLNLCIPAGHIRHKSPFPARSSYPFSSVRFHLLLA